MPAPPDTALPDPATQLAQWLGHAPPGFEDFILRLPDMAPRAQSIDCFYTLLRHRADALSPPAQQAAIARLQAFIQKNPDHYASKKEYPALIKKLKPEKPINPARP